MKKFPVILFLIVSLVAAYGQGPDKELLKNARPWGEDLFEEERKKEMKEAAGRKERFNRLLPKDLSYKFAPQLDQNELEVLLRNEDKFIAKRLRERFGENSKYFFNNYSRSIYFSAIAISLFLAYYFRKKSLETFISILLSLQILIYLSSINIGESLGDYLLILEYNIFKGLLLAVPAALSSIGYYYLLQNIPKLSNIQKVILVVGLVSISIWLLGYLTSDPYLGTGLFSNLKEAPFNILGALLTCLIVSYSLFEGNSERVKEKA